MFDRGSGEGRTRSDDPRGGDARNISNQNAPDADLDNERRSGSRDDSRGGVHSRESELGTSWTSVIFGWLAALGAGLILSGIVGGIVGAILGNSGAQGSAEGGVSALVGVLLTLLLAFLIGGYVAGRLASRSGLKHGILVPVLSLVVILLLGIIGSIVGASLLDNLSGVALPQVPGGVQQEAPQNLGTILTGAGIAALLVPFIGGALGGVWGAKTGRRRP
ncbi:hypothetical protein GBA65_14525 [Rubrobacter marinus]|uniref:Uncharacterized protein n=1 Tax=Rubrobacter marinus TaxID=2653852 RepID=A0A6G8PZ70_9ACTN|nr:hypothetical protein [Rubrobacter marinus]QIN79534.1 hypothetical protein GBA65_14525 [Rubrobacter marinus]